MNATSLNRGNAASKDCVLSDWTLSEDGWMLGSGGELLAWIPEDMRSTLYHTRNTVIMGQGFSTKLDLAKSPLGEDWCEGFRLSDEVASSRR
ncbi:hypothetical protein ACEPAF_5457 [Sanghuangporus sanghuang]